MTLYGYRFDSQTMCNEPHTHDGSPRCDFGKDKPQETNDMPDSVEKHGLPLLRLTT
jgi:hypothetical protein